MKKLVLVLAIILLGGVLITPFEALAQAPQPGPPAAAEGRAPFPPLPPAHQQFLDQVLQLWQQRSQAVERYRCTFKRWEYDPVFGPRDTFKTYSSGTIKYAAPDKGLFKVESVQEFVAAAQPGGKPEFKKREGDSGEFWICDGQYVFEHDLENKQLIQRELPPQMRGKAIAEGPLPFLFGADANQIKQRYWIQPLPIPEDVKGEYWLEAYPKTRQDAANYQKVHVIIDQSDFLPKGLVIFDRNFDPVRNPARTTFTFENREVNWSIALQQLRFWEREFFEPKTPGGWKKVIEKYQAPPNAEQYAPSAVAPGTAQATRPTAGPVPR